MGDVLELDNAEDFEVDDDGDRKFKIIHQSNKPNPIFQSQLNFEFTNTPN